MELGERGTYWQDILTDRVVCESPPDDVDVVLSMVGNWIDNTAFTEDCIKDGKQVVLFFNTYHDPKNTISSE